MSTYFVYRSHYAGPSGRHVRRFDSESVLGWFQRAWEPAKRAEDAYAWVKSEIGADVYGFASLFENARENDLSPPTSDGQLMAYLDEHLYVEGEIKYEPHALQVLTDDDEIELAYYLFDDEYVSQLPGRADYLLHGDWRLPTTSGESPFQAGTTAREVQPRAAGTGDTYLAFLAFYDSLGLTDLPECGGPHRISGVRLPQLVDYLETARPDDSWPFELRLLRSQVRSGESEDRALELALERIARLPVLRIGGSVSTDGLGMGPVDQARMEIEQLVKSLGGEPDHAPSKSLVATSSHLAQLCLHVGDFFGSDVYHQWFVFDDHWASAHRDLAEGLLRYAKRWDALT